MCSNCTLSGWFRRSHRHPLLLCRSRGMCSWPLMVMITLWSRVPRRGESAPVHCLRSRPQHTSAKSGRLRNSGVESMFSPRLCKSSPHAATLRLRAMGCRPVAALPCAEAGRGAEASSEQSCNGLEAVTDAGTSLPLESCASEGVT